VFVIAGPAEISTPQIISVELPRPATDAPPSRMLNPTALDEFTVMRRASSLVSHSAMLWLIKIEITIAFH
jgi:hypothetical protein